ncbi:hypothetical protein Dsin_022459 [Dipteronia sinensis]|uniref:Uncharacterized protein n=1 Tax=Dipteronia sinensis TaxID=43782 RepID=A0AAE0E031_9ROSI|nr:hypothetical protein Dsin_022459 [Dipteronia sinensis]
MYGENELDEDEMEVDEIDQEETNGEDMNVKEFEEDNEVDPEPVFQTQEQQPIEANEWRDFISLNMWTDAGHNDNNDNNEDEL